ncbi:unnamed protein product, partial [Protopolystoma xenopodis]
LVNKGNVLFRQGHFDRAIDSFREALQADASCVEAIYNLGLTYKHLGRSEEALDAFFKLHAVLRNSAPLHGLVPSDPFLLQRIGDAFEREGDKSQSFSYYYDPNMLSMGLDTEFGL